MHLKSRCAEICADSPSQSTSFKRVLDGRKQPIRNLWIRGERYYARLTVTLPSGAKREKRIALKARSTADAKAELANLMSQRANDSLHVACDAPALGDFVATYLTAHRHLKRERTLKCEAVHLRHWVAYFANVRLQRITKSGILNFRAKKLAEGWSGRSANLSLTILRNVLQHAIDNGLIQRSPASEIRPVRWVAKKRSLVAHADIENLCVAALQHLKHGQQLADYIKLMCYCGSRRNESLRLKWSDVD